jgi:hypothetical protein
MGIASQVVQDLVRSPEGRLGIDNPVFIKQLKEPGKGPGIGDLFEGAMELQLVILI